MYRGCAKERAASFIFCTRFLCWRSWFNCLYLSRKMQIRLLPLQVSGSATIKSKYRGFIKGGCSAITKLPLIN